MLHIKFSVRQTDITPTAKIAIDKSKLTLNKNSSRVQDEVEEQERKDRKDTGRYSLIFESLFGYRI